MLARKVHDNLVSEDGLYLFHAKANLFFFFTDGGLRIVCTLMSCSYRVFVSDTQTSIRLYISIGKMVKRLVCSICLM
jgi:hypothetical protein